MICLAPICAAAATLSSELTSFSSRLNNAKLNYDAQHQIIVPSKHCLAEMMVRDEHLRLLHAGFQTVLCSLRSFGFHLEKTW